MSAFKLDPDLAKRIAELESDIRAATQEFRDAWDDRSERWQESDAGTAAETWIEELDNLADSLEAVTDRPE